MRYAASSRIALSLSLMVALGFAAAACAQDVSPLTPDRQLRAGIKPDLLTTAAVPDIQWRRDLSEHTAELGFSADGRHIVMLGGGMLRLLDAGTAQIAYEQAADWPNGVIAVSATDRLAAVVFNYLDLYDLYSSQPIDRLPCPRCMDGVLAFSPDGSRLAHQDKHTPSERMRGIGVARVVDLEAKSVVELEAVTGAIAKVAFSRDGRRFLATHITQVGREEQLGYRVWDTADWSLLRTVALPGWTMGAIATGTVGRADFVAVHGNDGNIEMRDLSNDVVLWSVPMIPPQFAPSWSGVTEVELDRVAIAPNGSFVMSYERPRPASVDDIMAKEHGGLVIRRTEDGSILAVYDVPYLTRFAIAPDSKAFVYATPPHRPLAHLALVDVPR
jgi:dipeptidyl aminopeptidase/acylaminoacyl peptidase